MRTPLELPKEPLTGIKTKPQTISLARERVVQKAPLVELKEFRGQVDLDIDLDAVRGRRCCFQEVTIESLSC